MSKLNRSKDQSRNLWLELCPPNDDWYPLVCELQAFLKAPNNAFLACDILRRFLKYELILEKSLIDTSRALIQYFDTAKFCLNQFQIIFSEESDEFIYLNLEAFIQITRAKENRKKRLTKFQQKISSASYVTLNDEEFIETSLWHDYMDQYPLYVCLFYPLVNELDDLTVPFQFSLETYHHVMAFWLNLLAKHRIDITDSRLRDSSRAMRKIISKKVYRHLNTTDYQTLKNPCEFYEFIGDLKISSDSVFENKNENVLKDGSAFIQTDTLDNEIRWVTESIQALRAFLKSFCIDPNRGISHEAKRGKDQSERAKYNRQIGLALTKEIKQAHSIETLVLDDESIKFKVIRPYKDKKQDWPPDVLEDESDDDLAEESSADDILWAHNPPCETLNPISSLINSQTSLPHIALNNQLLRSRAMDSQIEDILEIFNKIIVLLDRDQEGLFIDEAKICVQWLLLLLTGRNITKVETEAFSLNESNVFLSLEKNLMRLSFPQYFHKNSLSNQNLYINSENDVLTLYWPPEIAELIRPLLEYLIEFSDSPSTLSLKIADKKKTDLLKSYRLKDFVYFVQRSYSAICNDSWLFSVFTCQVSGLQKTQKHYASFRTRKAQSIFENHCTSFLKIPVTPIVISYQRNDRFGSLFFLNRTVYKDIISWLWSHAQKLKTPIKYKTVVMEDLIFQFNCLAYWVESACSFAAATRNNIDPIIKLDLISREGLYRVDDKHKFDGFNTRLIYVPPLIQEYLKMYKKIRERVLTFISKSEIDLSINEQEILRGQQLFFFQVKRNGRFKVVPYTRSRCRDEIFQQARSKEMENQASNQPKANEFLRSIKTNANRHYLRGRLLDLEVPGNYIDALMGHWHSGTQPWGKMSIFDQREYLEVLKKHIPLILRELGFEEEKSKFD